MNKSLFILSLASLLVSPINAAGPKYQHKEPEKQLEFENVYKDLKYVYAAVVPSGVILMWSGSTGTIPSGWVLCNGDNGTPDLRDRFIVGAGSTYSVDGTGGSKDAIVVSHTHTASSAVTDPGHVHGIDSAVTGAGTRISQGTSSLGNINTGSKTTGISVDTTITSTGSSGTNANLPPYYALAYIMKS